MDIVGKHMPKQKQRLTTRTIERGRRVRRPLLGAARRLVDLGELAGFASARARLRAVLGRVLAAASRFARARSRE